MSTIVARLYYNPSYQGCDDKPCYFIYIPNGGSFISTPEETYKTFDTPTFDLTDDNVDSYAEARGFCKIIERMNDGSIVYYNGFDSPEKREDISRQMNKFKTCIKDQLKYIGYTFYGAKPIVLCYSIANSIESKVW